MRGRTLGADHEPTLDDWRLVVERAADLQRAVAGHRDAMLATGLPDCAPGTVLERFDAVYERLRTMPVGHPSRLTDEEAALLADRRGSVAAAGDLLVDAALPDTLQHGDLHPGNVFACDRGLFDFGDAQWAPAADWGEAPRRHVLRLFG
ncbi:MAG: phosphotransferase [Propionicimonas sp.]|nr:phosphotransferase [Propionicimonas sp.]